MTPAVRAIVYTNIGVFLATFIQPALVIDWLGLRPQAVIEQVRVWQVVTYLFVHDPRSIFHIIFNLLSVWMFGVELERRWGTRGFWKYYFVTGVGAGLCVVLVSLLPFGRTTYVVPTIGASGAVYGLLMAWALIFPYRQVLFIVFPLTARMFVLVVGAIAFFSALSTSGGTVSNLAHLGGLVIGYLYLKGPTDLRLAWQYRLSKWRMERTRRRFNVHKGGRNDWENRVH